MHCRAGRMIRCGARPAFASLRVSLLPWLPPSKTDVCNSAITRGQGNRSNRLWRAQEDELAVVIRAAFQLLVALGRLEGGGNSLLHHGECAGNEPTAVAGAGKCLRSQSLAIRRV